MTILSQNHQRSTRRGLAQEQVQLRPGDEADEAAGEEADEEADEEAGEAADEEADAEAGRRSGGRGSSPDESYCWLVDDDGRLAVDESGEAAGEADPQNHPAP